MQDCCCGDGDLLGGCGHDCKAIFPVWGQWDQQNGAGTCSHAGVVLLHLCIHVEIHTMRAQTYACTDTRMHRQMNLVHMT